MRLDWAKAHQNLANDELDSWTFSDEAPFELLCSSYRQRIWATPETMCKPNLVCPKAQGGFGKIMIWGVISVHGPGPLLFIEGGMNGESYKSIVRETIIPYLSQLADDFGRSFGFVADNAPCHNAKIVREEFAKSGANRINWPASSPDLNPIENIWGLMKMGLAKLTVKPRNMGELKGKILEIWKGLTPEYCKSIIYSMPQRCKEVVKAK